MAYPMPAGAAVLLGRSHGVTARIVGSVAGSAFVVPVTMVPGTGSVKVDAGSAVRRTLSCQLNVSMDHPVVDPFVSELRAEYGLVESSSGAVWWVPVGVFVLTGVTEVGAGVVAVEGADRWKRVQGARFERPVSTSGDSVAAMVELLQGADSRITVDATAALPGTHGASVWDRNRDDAVLQLARSTGNTVFMDAEGRAVIRPAPSLSDASVWQVGRGAGGVKVSGRRGVTVDSTYNAVVVIGQPQGKAPVYGVARDTDPASPTRYGGPFGKRPRFYTSSLITTTAQANAAAAGLLLARALGVARTLELETLPNPALDGGDVLTVEVEPSVWRRHLVESYTLPLGLGTTPLSTKSTATEDDDGQ